MPRPLMQHGVGQLEELFTRERENGKVLLQLQEELTHRQVPRAVDLLTKVRRALKHLEGLEPEKSESRPAPQQSEKRSADFKPENGSELFSSTSKADGSPRAPPQPAPPSSSISASEAYGLLGISPGASWESVEIARRALVQKASPVMTQAMTPLERDRLLNEAKRVNEAASVILKSRSPER